MKMLVLRPWLVMTLIFLLGIGSGVLLTLGLAPHFFGPPGAKEMQDRWMMHLTHRLNLTPDQQTKIQPIIASASSRIQAVHQSDKGTISGIMAEATSQISALLQPDQREELKKMERNRERMFMDRNHGGHGMGPDSGHRGPDGPPPAPPAG